MQALCGVKIGPWEAQVGCSVSVFGLLALCVVGVALLGSWTVWREGLIATGYQLVAGSHGRPDPNPYPPYPPLPIGPILFFLSPQRLPN